MDGVDAKIACGFGEGLCHVRDCNLCGSSGLLVCKVNHAVKCF